MPADHINISHPDSYDVESRHWRDRLEIEKLTVELKQLRMLYTTVCGNLESIFTRIDRGEPVELHFPDGRIFDLKGKKQP